MTVMHVTYDLNYLPQPNFVQVVFSDIPSPSELTASAFMVPVFDDKSCLMAINQRRGMEIPGGHVDPGETLVEAAVREAFEEAGCVVDDIISIGFLRMVVDADKAVKPEGYKYAYPLSYQQFFAGRVRSLQDYVPNDECTFPERVYDLSVLKSPRSRLFCEQAIKLLG